MTPWAAPYYFSAGCALASLQFCLFFLLESSVSSTWLSYASVTASWLTGSVAALLLPRPPAAVPTAAAAGVAYYACLAVLSARPFTDPALALGALAAALAGAYSGVFFREAYAESGAVAPLFAWENDGFIAGLAAVSAGLYLDARLLLWVAPAAALTAHCAVRHARRISNEPVQNPSAP
ncbi:MAG: hypothetical protein HY928_11870 [Elusimicrobia bacterium]|nr:hypothetical protein [Elusimicrobiota bacterium]